MANQANRWKRAWCWLRGGHFYLPQFRRCCRCDYLPKGPVDTP